MNPNTLFFSNQQLLSFTIAPMLFALTGAMVAAAPAPCLVPDFAAQTIFAQGAGPRDVIAADFNGDGLLDVVTADVFSGNVSILLGTGKGRFTRANAFQAGDGAIAIAAGSFTGGPKLDLVTANDTAKTVSLLYGDGQGGRPLARQFAVGSAPFAIAVGDFNNDGKPDVVTTNLFSSPGTVSVLLGDGIAGFAPEREFLAGRGPDSVAVGDFNGDGNLDIAVANRTSPGGVTILFGDGTGNFGPPVNLPLGSYFSRARYVVAADVNGDGKLDLAVAAFRIAAPGFPGALSILLGDGAGHFSLTSETVVGAFPRYIAVADIDGDGAVDFAVANTRSEEQTSDI